MNAYIDVEEMRRQAVELVAGEVKALLSSWRHTRCLAEEAPDLAQDDALHILAAWAHLRMFDPTAFTEGDREAAEAVEEAVKQDGGRLAQLAARAFDAEEWLRGLDELEQASGNVVCEDDLRRVNRAALALFRELDAADLARWAIRAVGCAGDFGEMRKGVGECVGQLKVKADLFVPAAGYKWAMHCACRRDLAEREPALALAAEKYAWVAEADCLVPFSEEQAEPLAPEQWRALLGVLERERKKDKNSKRERPENVFPIQPEGLPAAAAEVKQAFARGETLRYAPHDRSWTAWVQMPEKVRSRDDELALWVKDAAGGRIQEGAVVLGGKEFPIDEHGRAAIPYSAWDCHDSDTIRLRRGGEETEGKLVAPNG